MTPILLSRDECNERLIAHRPDIENRYKRWGHGSLLPAEGRSPAGLLCGKDCGPDPLLDLMDPLSRLESAS